jgi:NADPH-dependent 2,4-dienoyl-CoA reductase/sulfur reductase-like enzyme
MGERLLVVGGNAAGMSAAAQARRLAPEMEIIAVERTRWTSYSPCGIPYVAAGAVAEIKNLVARTPDEFRAMRIDVRTEHEVSGLDLDARRAEVRNLAHGRSFYLNFDKLHLATGARPRRPEIPGMDLPHVHGVQTLADGTRLLDYYKHRRPQKVVVAGSGYVGLEMADAFAARGAEVTVVEPGPEVLSAVDPEIGAIVARAARASGITVMTGAEVVAITEDAVETSAGARRADLVLLGLGVEPNNELAASAGLELGASGAIVVDRQQRTSAAGVWAAGDCCQSVHLVSGRPVHHPLGPTANKQGRVAGRNMTGHYASFRGVLGTAVTRVCGLEIGRTGLGHREARDGGFEVEVAQIESTMSASYMPDSRPITVRLLAEPGSGLLLGAQTAGGAGSAKRVDVVAAALAGRLTVEDLLELDLGYAPPVSSVWDPLQTAARRLLAQV